MSTVDTAFKAAFRDFNTDGVPGSGNKNPDKSDARGLGATIESYIAAQIAASLSTGLTPTGRLTLSSGTPVMTGNTAGATFVLYTPYFGALAPIWNGTSWALAAFSETTQALSDTTKSPSPAAASSVYDYFVWNDAGTIRCTRGPAWSSSISRGTGAGTSQLTRQSGLLVNQNSISNGPAAGYGLYVGTIATNASATVDFVPNPTPASGGAQASLSVWNMFNRRDAAALVIDNGLGYTYATNTVRSARNSAANRANFVCGLAEDSVVTIVKSIVQMTSGIGASLLYSGIGLDATSAFYNGISSLFTEAFGNSIGAIESHVIIPPQIGFHYVQRLENSSGSANTFNYGAADVLQILLQM